MDIVIAGGTGFIGEAVVHRLVERGDDVAVLSRNPAKVTTGRGVQWDGRGGGAWTAEVDRADAVINLAGENIGGGRWTDQRKRALIDSRIDATTAVVSALGKAIPRKRVLINASAVGYYGFDGDAEADENAPKGTGFLADLVAKWEVAARKAQSSARVVLLRFGVVLGPGGGALEKMLMPFRFGAGGPVGSGNQWMSWVDRDDVIRAVEWALDRDAVRGVYNVTSPEPVRNREFAKTVGRVMHRPAFMPAPAFALRLAFGEMADEVLLGGQRAIPRRAIAEGFAFSRPSLSDSLQNAIER